MLVARFLTTETYWFHKKTEFKVDGGDGVFIRVCVGCLGTDGGEDFEAVCSELGTLKFTKISLQIN